MKTENNDVEVVPRPFLKWAGSKKQLQGYIKDEFLKVIKPGARLTFVDGFLGSGAITFMVMNECLGEADIDIVANDYNSDLIGCFKAVQNQTKPLIAALERLEQDFKSSPDGEAFYYATRAEFNDRSKCKSQIDRAAHFIFLNHTCYNGLYRVNSKGEFNVPYGKRQDVKTFQPEVILADGKAFRRHKVRFVCGDFKALGEKYRLRPDETLFYFDPPYRPIKPESFAKYNKDDFSEEDQKRLAQYCCQLCDQGATVVASNSFTHDTFYAEHYKGFTVTPVSVKRMLHADVSKRGPITEVLLSRTGAMPPL